MPRAMGQPETEDAARRILDACACAYARWFLAMRRCIGQERVRQRMFKEENGLPKSARLPYVRPVLAATDKVAAESSEAVIRAMFGDAPADYARDKFYDAIATGDMRAFKIRLLVIKTRDSLAGSSIHRYFVSGMEDCISRAESMAGCIPDPSPRRLSRCERRKRQAKQETVAKASGIQMELQLEWPVAHKQNSNQDIDPSANEADTTGKDLTGEENVPAKEVESRDLEKSNFKLCEKCPSVEDALYVKGGRLSAKKIKDSKKQYSVTVTQSSSANVKNEKNVGKQDLGPSLSDPSPSRYDSVEGILDDIESGKINPYLSVDEICSDMKQGKIGAVDALMFVAAMSDYMQGHNADEEGDGAEDDMQDGYMDGRAADGDFSYVSYGSDGDNDGYSRSDAEWDPDSAW